VAAPQRGTTQIAVSMDSWQLPPDGMSRGEILQRTPGLDRPASS